MDKVRSGEGMHFVSQAHTSTKMSTCVCVCVCLCGLCNSASVYLLTGCRQHKMPDPIYKIGFSSADVLTECVKVLSSKQTFQKTSRLQKCHPHWSCFFCQTRTVLMMVLSSIPSRLPLGTFQSWWVTDWPIRLTTQKWILTSRSLTWQSGSRLCSWKSWATGWRMHWTAMMWTSRMQVGVFLHIFVPLNYFVVFFKRVTFRIPDIWMPVLNQSCWQQGTEAQIPPANY